MRDVNCEKTANNGTKARPMEAEVITYPRALPLIAVGRNAEIIAGPTATIIPPPIPSLPKARRRLVTVRK
jgi:hypothetical protein